MVSSGEGARLIVDCRFVQNRARSGSHDGMASLRAEVTHNAPIS